MRGIDISNNNPNVSPASLPIDFCICKATEGIGFVDQFCDKWISELERAGIPWGFYHYGRENDPVAEAQFFMRQTEGYWGRGIPVLDWETTQDVNWVNAFVREIHKVKGVWCWIYANPWRFNQGGVEENCMRWIADYPNVLRPSLDYDPGEPPATDGLVGCWQFASDGQVDGYDGDLDVNVFYGDREAWGKYAGSCNENEVTPTHETDVLENDRYKVTIERK